MTAPPADPGRRARMAGTLARVAAEFRVELPGRLARAQQLLEACLADPADEASLQALVLLLHSLAGTAGTLGLPAVGDAARACERAALALRSQPGRSAQDFGALRGGLEELSDRIREACASPP